MKKYLQYFVLFLFAISVFVNVYFLVSKKHTDTSNIYASNTNMENLYFAIDNFTSVLSIINYAYYKDVPPETLINYAIKGMLNSLDPYSNLLDTEAHKELKNYTSGEFYGIGIEITQNADKSIEIVSPIENSPAFYAGILSGDKISLIDGKSISNMNLNQVSQKLQGKKGSKIELTVIRQLKNSRTYTVSLERKLVKIPNIRSEIYNDIAYIKINTFNKTTKSRLVESINQIKSSIPNFKGLILDLRNNPGGLFDQAIEVADLFLDSGKIAFLKSKNNNDEVYLATKGDIIDSLPLIVLTNNGTASASEVVAGALKDNNRAILLGTTTYGKGVVQTIIPINSYGEEIKLTTGSYYLPKGESIHKVGIAPDIFYFANNVDCNNCSTERLENLKIQETNYLFEKNQNNYDYPDYQLKKALELINKYG